MSFGPLMVSYLKSCTYPNRKKDYRVIFSRPQISISTEKLRENLRKVNNSII